MGKQRARVMIIEQDWGDGVTLADWLAVQGYQPVLLRSLDAAMAELSSIGPCAIIVALGPSAAEVQQATAVLRKADSAGLPVIMIMHEADANHIPLVIRQAARRCLCKPLQLAEIREVLQSELNRQQEITLLSEPDTGRKLSISQNCNKPLPISQVPRIGLGDRRCLRP